MYVGPYRLLTRIGEGGMGVVHLGQHHDGRRVAIKVLRPHVVSDHEARARLSREVNSLSRVHSPRVAEIIDADPWGPIPYVATRYVPGLSLHQYVGEEGALEGSGLVHFARGLAQALQAVHDVGVLHRDVKPSNVLMEGRNPVLIDFGLARLDDDMVVTRTGYLLGTPGYLAPETLFGADPTPASDVHSWAATVAFAGTGRAPYGTGHALVVMDRVRRGGHDLEGLDPFLRPLVVAALDLDPARRPTLPQVLHLLDVAPTTVRAPAAPLDEPPMTIPMAASPDHHATRVLDAEPPTLVDISPPTRVEPPHPAEHRPRAQAPTTPLPPQQQPAVSPARAPFQMPPPAPPRRTPWPERLRRWTLGAAATAAVAGATAWAPWLMAGLVVAAVSMLRAGSLTWSARTAKRTARGPKWWDPIATVVAAPWHLVVSSLATVALLLWAGMLVACVLLLALALGLPDHVALASSALVLVAGLWTGPGSSRVRSPIHRVGFPIARTTRAWAVWCAALAIVGGALLLLGASGPEWWPDDRAPWGDGTVLGRHL